MLAAATGSIVEAIARRLLISPRTVHKHQQNLYRKLGAIDRLSAVLRAQEAGLLPQPPRPHTAPAQLGSSATHSVRSADRSMVRDSKSPSDR